jgi:hypothetical protein
MTTPTGRKEGYDLSNVDFSFVGPQSNPALKITKKEDNYTSTLVIHQNDLSERDQSACIMLCLQKISQQQAAMHTRVDKCIDDVEKCTQRVERNGKNLERCIDTVKDNNRVLAQITGASIPSDFPRVEEINDDPDEKSFIDKAIDCFKPPIYFIGRLLVSVAKGLTSFFAWSAGR